MSSYYDKYKARMGAYGSSESDAFGQATINAINQQFTSSTSYRQATIHGTSTNVDVRFVDGKPINDSHDKFLLFRPKTVMPMGTILTIGSDNWMLMDSDWNNPIVPKATIQRVNQSLTWLDESRMQHTTLCIATADTKPRERPTIQYGSKDGINDIRYEMAFYVPLNSDTLTIKIGTRFILENLSYEVFGMDALSNVYNGQGYMTVLTTIVNNQPSNDVNGLANVNTTSSGGGSAW